MGFEKQPHHSPDKPEIAFFSELSAEKLSGVYTKQVVEELGKQQYRISLAIPDFSKERASLVRTLNSENVPLEVWLLLPKKEGYWFNTDNYIKAISRYEEFKKWQGTNKLRFDAVGFDMEPSLSLMQDWLKTEFLPQKLQRMIQGRASKETVLRATSAYNQLANLARKDGFKIHTYHFPHILDERKAGGQIIRQLFHIPDITAERDVFMTYSTGYDEILGMNLQGAAVHGYPDAKCVGLGITGAGVDLGDNSKVLSFEELARDIRLASVFAQAIYIYSLEGSVKQGYFKKIKDVKAETVQIPPFQRMAIQMMRLSIQAISRLDRLSQKTPAPARRKSLEFNENQV